MCQLNLLLNDQLGDLWFTHSLPTYDDHGGLCDYWYNFLTQTDSAGGDPDDLLCWSARLVDDTIYFHSESARTLFLLRFA